MRCLWRLGLVVAYAHALLLPPQAGKQSKSHGLVTRDHNGSYDTTYANLSNLLLYNSTTQNSTDLSKEKDASPSNDKEFYACSFKSERYSVEPYFIDTSPKLNLKDWGLLIDLANALDRTWLTKYLTKTRKIASNDAELTLSPYDGFAGQAPPPKLLNQVAAQCLAEFYEIARRQGRTYEVLFYIVDKDETRLAFGTLHKDEEASSKEGGTITEYVKRGVEEDHLRSKSGFARSSKDKRGASETPPSNDTAETLSAFPILNPVGTIFPIKANRTNPYQYQIRASYDTSSHLILPTSEVRALFEGALAIMREYARAGPWDPWWHPPIPVVQVRQLGPRYLGLTLSPVGWQLRTKVFDWLVDAMESIVEAMQDDKRVYECDFVVWDTSTAISVRLMTATLHYVQFQENPSGLSAQQNGTTQEMGGGRSALIGNVSTEQTTVTEIARPKSKRSARPQNILSVRNETDVSHGEHSEDQSIFPIHFDWQRPLEYYVAACDTPPNPRTISPNAAVQVIFERLRSKLSSQIQRHTQTIGLGAAIQAHIGEDEVVFQVMWGNVDIGVWDDQKEAMSRGLNCVTAIIAALHEEAGASMKEGGWRCAERAWDTDRTILLGRVDILHRDEEDDDEDVAGRRNETITAMR